MAATLLFVHGTGVREPAYTSTLARIAQAVDEHGLPLLVEGCYWGGCEGARTRADGLSIPTYAATGGKPPDAVEQRLALWSVLYSDPWYELRLLRHMPKSPPPFGKNPSALLRQQVMTFVSSEELNAALIQAGIAQYFGTALEAIRAAPELNQATATAPASPLEHRQAIARAIVAYALVTSDHAGDPPPDGGTRDAIVETLTDELLGYGLGVGEWLKNLVLDKVTKKATGDRGEISDKTTPGAGDILRFLARGDGARTYINARIEDAPGPVYVLAHSLGGIMCVDLLASRDIPQVAGLITVGSQAPYLYEIGALPALMHPEPLPEHFPPWTNIYDHRDILSYIGAGVLGAGVTDVRVDNRQPFPQAHSAYWSNPKVWDAVAVAIR